MDESSKMSTVSMSRKGMLAHLMKSLGVDKHLAAEVLYRADSGYCDVTKDGKTQRVTVLHTLGFFSSNRYSVVDI